MTVKAKAPIITEVTIFGVITIIAIVMVTPANIVLTHGIWPFGAVSGIWPFHPAFSRHTWYLTLFLGLFATHMVFGILI